MTIFLMLNVVAGLVEAADVIAVRSPSMAFLEYLGAEEVELDGELNSPVDMDLERYLVNRQWQNNSPASTVNDPYGNGVDIDRNQPGNDETGISEGNDYE